MTRVGVVLGGVIAGLIELAKGVGGLPSCGGAGLLVGPLALVGAALAWRQSRGAVAPLLGAGVAAVAVDVLCTPPPPHMLPGIALMVAGAFAWEGPGGSILAWIGLALHVLVGVPFLAVGLVAPWYGVLVMWICWVLLLVVALRLRSRRPWVTLAAPFAAAAVFLGTLWLGGTYLGWTP